MNAKSELERKALGNASQSTVIQTYEELQRYAKAFADGHLGLLLVLGVPGVGKSRTVIDAIDGDFCLLTGAATAFGMYAELYRHCDELVVIEEVPKLLLKHSRRPDPQNTQSLLDWLQRRGRRFGSG